MNASYHPSATLILGETEIETILSIIHDLAELSIRVLTIKAS
jgi:hypothetical protein